MNRKPEDFRRIVVKIGSSLLVDRDNGRLRSDWLSALIPIALVGAFIALLVRWSEATCPDFGRIASRMLAQQISPAWIAMSAASTTALMRGSSRAWVSEMMATVTMAIGVVGVIRSVEHKRMII